MMMLRNGGMQQQQQYNNSSRNDLQNRIRAVHNNAAAYYNSAANNKRGSQERMHKYPTTDSLTSEIFVDNSNEVPVNTLKQSNRGRSQVSTSRLSVGSVLADDGDDPSYDLDLQQSVSLQSGMEKKKKKRPSSQRKKDVTMVVVRSPRAPPPPPPRPMSKQRSSSPPPEVNTLRPVPALRGKEFADSKRSSTVSNIFDAYSDTE